MTTPFLSTIEETLFAELRILQTLVSLTEKERAALQADDVDWLATVLEQKDIQMNDLNRLETARELAIGDWARAEGLEVEPPLTLDLALAQLDRASARRLRSVRDGILAHLDRVRSLGVANRLLVNTALERNAAVRAFLVHMVSGGDTYGPAGIVHPHGPVSNLMEWSG
ncbi:MAG: flagellar protein FlgN [Chloroflexi bacterium]|nr:flagellar protein FlgN [Chloroflexota bacterium]